MRAARLPAFAALLGLHILGVQGETTCYTDDLLTNWSVDDLSRLQGALVGPVFDLCNKGFTPGEDEVLTQQVGDVSFAIVREATAQDGADCKSAFSTIIKQCVIGQKVGGGVIESLSGNGVLYEVSHANAVHEKLEGSHVDVRDEDKFDVEEGHLDGFMDLVGHDSSLETRAPKGGRAKTPKAKPKTPKPKPKPKTPTAKPKPKVSKAPKSKPAKASKTTSSAKPLATKSCDQLYAMALASRINEKPLARRAGFVGSMAHIEKRNQKDGTACGIELNALDYPEDLVSFPLNLAPRLHSTVV
jgi:cell division septation protein DedD